MHHRKRHIQEIMLKRSKIFPVVGLLGPRQVGKSTFLIQDCKKLFSAEYVTFDQHEIAIRAKSSPENFLLAETDNLNKKLIIDEVQKVPQIFDSIKYLIDQNRRVGLFTVSGSVEFSNRAGVRESLAGRIGTCRLYPLTINEINNRDFEYPWIDFFKTNKKKPTDMKSLEMWLARGGMPIFCALGDIDERNLAIQNWLEAICYRDLNQLKSIKFDGGLAIEILREVAKSGFMNSSNFAAQTGCSRLEINNYLQALESLFLIYKLPNFSNRRSRPKYTIFDAGVIRYLTNDNSFDTRLRTLECLMINEILAQNEYHSAKRLELFYNRSSGGSEVDLVINYENKIIAINFSLTAEIGTYQCRSMQAFQKKYPEAKCFILAPINKQFSFDANIEVVPW